MFCERLINYRSSLKLLKREFAEKLGVSESYYNMIENGKRSPSSSFLHKLVALSEKPEEFWLYGVNQQEYITSRDDFKATKKATEQLIDLGLINDVDSLFKGTYKEGTLEELLIAALKNDIEYLIKKKTK
ncbi:helix-turn-helix protein [Clostridium puniceum]|uniref:Helix-turn-helix protein n=1 Tax=Clostridium puniceum TaxID=29367 RepID=A0A1S8T1A9_9CLOT|nr:helix-turn-helix transcriptional regulator [Clostridium puniceum]OOM71468.1 helix-turn-helix protein [Clostridium puniceum]